MARTFPTVGQSPIDAFSAVCDRPIAYFEWDVPSSVTTALDGCVYIKVADGAATTSGYQKGLYINYTNDGAKTSTAEINALGIDVTVSAAVPYAYVQSVYFTTSGNPTVGLASALTIYVDNLGTATASMHILDLQTANPTASAATTREAYIRCRNHGTGTPTSIFFLQANNNASAATNFVEQDSVTVGPVFDSVTAISSGTNTTHRITCKHGTTTFYLLGVAAT